MKTKMEQIKMKKTSVGLLIVGLLVSMVLVECITPAQKVKAARNNVTKANDKLDEAKKEYLEDVAAYRKEIADKIASNNLKIAAFEAKIENEKDDNKTSYKEKINELKKKNNDMKMRIDNYRVEGKEKWAMFKNEFSHDMEELGKAFKDLVIKNTN